MATMTEAIRRQAPIIGLLVTLGLLAGCGSSTARYPKDRPKGATSPVYEEPDTVFGEGGLSIGGSGDKADQGSGYGIGVNSFLWRASLDTVSFMPIATADPFGGVILTDWYSPSETPNERFKVQVFILGRGLRADGVRAQVFRETNDTGGWVTAQVAANTATDLENTILMRARQLRISQFGE
jgi:Domain of unknown function (DUF3576)